MRTGLGKAAYTIVEVMIFMGVSSLLFFIVASTVGGQQTKNQFNLSIRNFESRLRDLANDVSTGNYSSLNNFRCYLIGSGQVKIDTSVSVPRGENSECIFAGQVLVFDPSQNSNGTPANQMQIIAIAGRRQKPVGISFQEVSNLAEADPEPIDNSVTVEDMGPIDLASMTYSDGVTTSNASAIGLMTTFKSYTGGNLDSGDIRVDLAPFDPVGRPVLTGNKIKNALTDAGLDINPKEGVIFCFEGGANQNATVTLGGNGRQFNTNVVYGTGDCP